MEYTRYTRLQSRTGLQTAKLANLTAQLNLNINVNCSGVHKVLHNHRIFTETTLFQGYNVYENSATGELRKQTWMHARRIE